MAFVQWPGAKPSGFCECWTTMGLCTDVPVPTKPASRLEFGGLGPRVVCCDNDSRHNCCYAAIILVPVLYVSRCLASSHRIAAKRHQEWVIHLQAQKRILSSNVWSTLSSSGAGSGIRLVLATALGDTGTRPTAHNHCRCFWRYTNNSWGQLLSREHYSWEILNSFFQAM